MAQKPMLRGEVGARALKSGEAPRKKVGSSTILALARLHTDAFIKSSSHQAHQARIKESGMLGRAVD
jgi:hypothetical protein